MNKDTDSINAALSDLENAIWRVNRLWDNNAEGVDIGKIASDWYPFEWDIDEVAVAVTNWVSTIKMETNKN